VDPDRVLALVRAIPGAALSAASVLTVPSPETGRLLPELMRLLTSIERAA
jgi:hypothetical protein